jgi:hypothetical protein
VSLDIPVADVVRASETVASGYRRRNQSSKAGRNRSGSRLDRRISEGSSVITE